MVKYRVDISEPAEEDLRDIVRYISTQLSVPMTAMKMMEAIEESDSKLIIAVPGQKYTFGDASFNLLAPVSDNYTSLNDWSVVLRLDYGITSFLFTGDAEIVSENEMMTLKANETNFEKL